MKIGKLISYFVLVGIILSIPSMAYLINNVGDISNYSEEYYYLIGDKSSILNKYGAIIYALSIIFMFFIYWKLIKNSDKFKNIKSILIMACIVCFSFILILPNTSKDIFFYMGNGRLVDKYDVNPYSVTVSDMKNIEQEDKILNVVGSQSNYNFVYGPIFLTICGLLNKISFSSVLIFLYEFKILNFLAYLLTVYLVYKLTKKKKLTVLYAFNPLLILETIINVHNDIFVLMFALMAIYFIKEAEKCRDKFVKSELVFMCGLIFLTFSACIKYIAILILPFIILYRLREYNILKKFFVGIAYIFVFFGMFEVMYLPYFESLEGIFSGALTQSGKLKDSIYLLISIISHNNNNIVSTFYSIGFFVLFYIFIIKVLMQLMRKNNFKVMMENSYIVLLATIFLGLTNLTSWYLIWLFIPIFWTNGKNLKNFIWIGFLYELTYVIFYITHSDDAKYQVLILPWIVFGMIARKFIINVQKNI